MAEHYVGKLSEFAEKDRRIVIAGAVEVGVFHIGGEFYAYENTCPHQGGPVCQGRLLKRVVEVIGADRTSKGLNFSDDDLHLVCPWHGFEFNIRTGRHPGDRKSVLTPFGVRIENDDVFVTV